MRLILILLMTCFLGACTSENKDLKSLAEAKGETYLKLKMSQEAYSSTDVSPYLQSAYIDYMVKKAQVRAEDPKVSQSGTAATVDLTMTLYSQNLRKTILGVAAKVAPNKVRSFNLSDAINLISQQGDDLKPELVDQPLITLEFAKTPSGWVIQEH